MIHVKCKGADRAKLLRVAKRIERKIMGMPFEHLYALDKDGNVILHLVGEERNTHIAGDDFDLLKKRACVIIHNHPSTGNSFSVKDVKAAFVLEVPWLRLTNRKGIVYDLRVNNKMLGVFEDLEDRAYRHINRGNEKRYELDLSRALAEAAHRTHNRYRAYR
jgi:hypothetical protein